MAHTIMLVAGEASGDLHGAEIVNHLRSHNADTNYIGMGSKKMHAAGVDLLVDSANIAVVGLFEVLAHWSEIQAALNTLRKQIADNPPDLLVLIDYPEFNLKLAKFAKAHGVKVLFYVSPQVWAWRSGRVKKIGKRIDMMAVVFPFEVPFYKKENIPVRYVGHPLTQKVKPKLTRQQAIQQFGLHESHKTVALLPGSRAGEIQRILPVIAESAELIKRSHSNTQFIIPVAATIDKSTVLDILKQYDLAVTLIDEQAYDVVNCSDSVIVASGTATLEVALLGIPMAIVYRVAPLSYFIMSRLIEVPYVGLVNIVAGRKIMPEFIQKDASAQNIAAEILRQLNDTTYRNDLSAALSITKQNLGDMDGIKTVSELILDMLENST